MKLLPFVLVATLGLVACGRQVDDSSLHEQWLRGQEAWNKGDLQGARDFGLACLAMDDGFLPGLVLVGKASWLLGLDEEAGTYLADAWSHKGHGSEAALWFGRYLRSTDQVARAIEVVDIALVADAQSPTLLRLRAQLAEDQGDVLAQGGYLTRALQGRVELGLVALDRASVLWAGGDRQGALADLELAKVLLPLEHPSYKALEQLKQAVSEL